MHLFTSAFDCGYYVTCFQVSALTSPQLLDLRLFAIVTEMKLGNPVTLSKVVKIWNCEAVSTATVRMFHK